MSTSIEWVKNPDGTKGQTWNPLVGCKKVSPGCKNCYAERMAQRLKAMGMESYQEVVNEKGWSGKIQLVESVLEKPLKRKKPTVYFVNSMSDLFHKDVPVEFIQKVFQVMQETPQHIYQILTKRHERLSEVSPLLDWSNNIWMGVSVESQKYVHRVDYLRDIPAGVRFLSCEPLLTNLQLDLTNIDWVIVGGESGFNYRQIKEKWVENILNQCQEANVPFFFKQWGGVHPKSGGRVLNNQVYNEMPNCWYEHLEKWNIQIKEQQAS
jgi:protein gp37